MVKAAQAPVRFFFLICISGAVWFGCTESRTGSAAEDAAPAGSSSEQTASADSQEQSRGGRLRLEMEAERPPEDKDLKATVLRRLESGRQVLLAVPRELPVIPRDTEIGELQNSELFPQPGEERVYTVVVDFLEQLTEGIIAADLIAEEWRLPLHISLKDPLESGGIPERFRVGSIGLEDGSARANVRLLSQKGRCAGEIFIERFGTEWKITDFQIDLYQLLDDYNAPGPFEPKMYDVSTFF